MEPPIHEPSTDAAQPQSELAAPGFPAFEHNQWTIEGEIERFGAFGRGASQARGWKRTVALVVVAAMLLPIVLSVVSIVLRASR